MPYSSIIIIVVFIGMMFFMQRQQKKRVQERQDQMNSLQKGDEIVTIGGLYAIVDEVDTANQKIVLDVDGVYLTYELGAVKSVIAKGGQASDATETDDAIETEDNTSDSQTAIEE
ncbi:preprotein translocase subunit YajC [Streptococcus ferus]|uniref:Preprotein translocase subunit YajC (TC 3.A.5.1.1) n=1 Tax=Streptococcus ferus TaxID=1345 RepID=A0A2X3W9F2_9STRE|nr:preprotein translocase subunit YajC [Streptococcus ferus]SQF40976.1 Preprotein translocase subunit YajC (TC 3.A.5.1.1) [Streptococcus ferus]